MLMLLLRVRACAGPDAANACRKLHGGIAVANRRLHQQTADPLSAASDSTSKALAPASAAAIQTAVGVLSAFAGPAQTAQQQVAAVLANASGVVITPAVVTNGKTPAYKSPRVEVTGSPVAAPDGFVFVVLGDSISDDGR